MIQVVHVKKFGKIDKALPDGQYIYCGRPSKYGNDYILRREEDRAKVINKFAVNQLPDMDVSELIRYAKEGNLYLGCFCAPKACHCDEIKNEIERHLEGKVCYR